VIDIHSHVMPGVDDGACDIDEAVTALSALQRAGVEHVVATPHLDASLTARRAAYAARLDQLDVAWRELTAAVTPALPSVSRGAEIMLDVPEPDFSDPRLRLDGTDFVLVEFPWAPLPPHSARALIWIRDAGYVPVVAHPERYPDAGDCLDLIHEWRQHGAYLQCNCGSLTGSYGGGARDVAIELLRRGWIDYLAGDYHARGPLPQDGCAAVLDALGAGDLFTVLTMTNPQRLRANRAPLPVAPLPAADTLWQRLARVFR
jgi:protein-tyrosine phosphatase